MQFRVSQSLNVALKLQFSHRRSLFHTLARGYAGLRTNLICYSTVPTNDHIMVPETLLKKRKSQEKARAERTALTEKRKAVSSLLYLSPFTQPWHCFSDAQHNLSTRHQSMLLIINLLSGLIIHLTSSFRLCQ